MRCSRCHREIPDNSKFCAYCGKRLSTVEAQQRRRTRRANGTGSVYRLPGNRSRPWTALKGGVYIGYYPTKSEAQMALERLAGKELHETYNYTLQQVFDCWRPEHFPTLTEKGKEMYLVAWKRFEPLKQRKMREIRTADYQGIINAMEDEGLSVSSASKVKQLAGQLSKWAMREDIITTNYAQFVRLYTEESKERETFTAEEISTLAAHEESDAVKIILLLIYTGLRINELFTMTRDNVHLEEGYMVGGSKTRAGRDRVIPLLDEAVPHVQYFYDKSRPGGLLLDGYDGNKSPNNFRRREYADTLKALGIRPLTPHSTRHTFASLAVKAGVRPEFLQPIIGHANYATTVNIYHHSNIGDLRAEMQKLTNYLQSNSGQPKESK